MYLTLTFGYSPRAADVADPGVVGRVDGGVGVVGRLDSAGAIVGGSGFVVDRVDSVGRADGCVGGIDGIVGGVGLLDGAGGVS